jgi:hypothetical protein
MPTPVQVRTFANAVGLAFDKSHNLWAVIDPNQVVEFTAAQLKSLKNNQSPMPSGGTSAKTSLMAIPSKIGYQDAARACPIFP